MASKRKRTQCYEKRANEIRYSKRSIKPSLKPTSNSIETLDKPKQFTKEYSLPKKNHRLLQEKLNVEEHIINYLLEMRKKGRKPATLQTVSDRLRLLATHCNILDPEEEGKLINVGFELVRAVNETTTIYRKRK